MLLADLQRGLTDTKSDAEKAAVLTSLKTVADPADGDYDAGDGARRNARHQVKAVALADGLNVPFADSLKLFRA